MTGQEFQKLKLPDSPGIYTFRDARKRPLYIGRATSLHDRVKSYFSHDIIAARGPRIVDLVTKARTISWQETDSVLEAIILESTLIKRYHPFYNIDEQDDKSSQYVIITKELWPRVFLARARDVEQLKAEGKLPYKVKKMFGPYPHGGLIKEALKILRRMFPFRDIKAHDPRHEAFYRALGKSPEGSDISARRRYRRTIDNLIMFFEGKKARLQKRLERDMRSHARRMEFEDAGRAKRLLYALDHVNDMALLKRDTNPSVGQFRLEAYDVAHLSGTNVVGSMVVSVRGQFVPSEYRKFKIGRDANNDIVALVEILSRRLNHSEWTYPDLIIVDGNEVQKRAAEAVLKARRVNIPVVAVTKDEKHRAANLIGQDEVIERHKTEIIALNAEAHRFTIRYHRTLRRTAQGIFKKN